MFELDQFIADCRAALTSDAPHKAVREVVARAVSEPAAVLRALGEPRRAELRKLYCSGELTVLNVVWAPGMTLLPHDHRMWAVIGIYTGREDNIFWRRVRGDPGGKVEAVSARSVGQKEAIPLGDQPRSPADRWHPRLRRRLLRHPPQRMGPGDALGATFGRRAHDAPVRGSERTVVEALTLGVYPPTPGTGVVIGDSRRYSDGRDPCIVE